MNINNNYVIRFFTGKLSGTLFSLIPGHYQLIVGDEQSICQWSEQHNNKNDKDFIQLYVPTHQQNKLIIIDVILPNIDNQQDSFCYSINEKNKPAKSLEAKFNYPTFWQKIPLFAIKKVDEKWCDECENLSCLIEKSYKSNKNYLIKIATTFLLLVLFLFCYYVFSYEVNINKKFLFTKGVINHSQAFDCEQFLNKKNNIKKIVDEINSSISNTERFYFHIVNYNSISFIYQNKITKEMIKELLNKYQPCQFNVNAILLSDLINYVDNKISNRVKSYKLWLSEKGLIIQLREVLTEDEIYQLKSQLKPYQTQLGKNFFQFLLPEEQETELEKTQLKSTKGYIFVQPEHRYFPAG